MFLSGLRASIFLFSHTLPLISADPDYQYPTGDCSPNEGLGNSIFCCDGDCYDGTTIFDRTGLCQGFASLCPDVNPPDCAANQVFDSGGFDFVDAGLGGCYFGDDCLWQQFLYSWNCCTCPDNYVAIGNYCGADVPDAGLCFGCTGLTEWILFNNVSDSYVCDGAPFRQKACDFENSLSNWISVADLASTWAGALCPGANPASLAINLLEDAIDAMEYISDPNGRSGVTGSGVSLASQLLGTFNSWVIGAGIAAGLAAGADVAAALGATYAAACTINTALNAGLTAAGALLGDLEHQTCPPSSKKARSISADAFVRDVATKSLRNVARDGTDYDPCSEFVGQIPSNYDAMNALQAACNDVSQYSAADTLDSDIAAAASIIQQVCGQLYDSGEFTLFQDFASMLDAFIPVEPYCDNSTIPVPLPTTSLPNNSTIIPTIPPVSIGSLTDTSTTTVITTSTVPPNNSTMTTSSSSAVVSTSSTTSSSSTSTTPSSTSSSTAPTTTVTTKSSTLSTKTSIPKSSTTSSKKSSTKSTATSTAKSSAKSTTSTSKKPTTSTSSTKSSMKTSSATKPTTTTKSSVKSTTTTSTIKSSTKSSTVTPTKSTAKSSAKSTTKPPTKSSTTTSSVKSVTTTHPKPSTKPTLTSSKKSTATPTTKKSSAKSSTTSSKKPSTTSSAKSSQTTTAKSTAKPTTKTST